MSHSHTTTIDGGFLYPLWSEEVLPGDSISFKPSFLARLSTPLKPYMSGIFIEWQAFFTPTRLLWDNFVKMMGEREDPGDHNDYTVPQITAPSGGWTSNSLEDYLTFPVLRDDITHTSLYQRNYNLIFREWYRDSNLQDSPVVDKSDGPDDPADYTLLRRGKRKDYFAGSLPFAQRGDPVELPLGGTAPLGGIPMIDSPSAPSFAIAGSPSEISTLQAAVTSLQVSAPNVNAGGGVLGWSSPGLQIDLQTGLFPGLEPFADLSAASGFSIQALRQSISLQHLLERDARGGGRYREQVLAHWNIQTDDIRLLRPQLLAVGSTPVNPSPVPQTVPEDTSTPQGNLAAYAVAAGTGGSFSFTSREHGICMLLVSVRADLIYQQGLARRFSRLTRVDHFWPDLAALGEQAVLSQELYADGTGTPAAGGTAGTGDFEIWGFMPRYEEYRHRQNVITGTMRSDHPQSLDIWHVAQDFSTRPSLNAAFIEEQPPIDRIVAVPSEPSFLVDCFFKVKHVRAMPKFGNPGLDRF